MKRLSGFVLVGQVSRPRDRYEGLRDLACAHCETQVLTHGGINEYVPRTQPQYKNAL